MGIDESAVSALLDANAKEFVDRPAWWEVALKVLGVLFCIFLLLAALVAGRIAYVAYVKAQRKSAGWHAAVLPCSRRSRALCPACSSRGPYTARP
ncbi:MAG: hypothetical protein ACLVJ8_08220 [Ruthenibacterium lactatiformans]